MIWNMIKFSYKVWVTKIKGKRPNNWQFERDTMLHLQSHTVITSEDSVEKASELSVKNQLFVLI